MSPHSYVNGSTWTHLVIMHMHEDKIKPVPSHENHFLSEHEEDP